MKIDLSNIDLKTIDEFDVYELLGVDGREEEALNDGYYELFQLIGKEAMLKLFKFYHGSKFECPMKLYSPDFVTDLARDATSRRDRALIARLGGYSAKSIDNMLNKRKIDEDEESDK